MNSFIFISGLNNYFLLVGNGPSLTILKSAMHDKVTSENYQSPLTVLIGSSTPLCLTDGPSDRQPFVVQVSSAGPSDIPCLYVQPQTYDPPRLALQLLPKVSSASVAPPHSVIVSQPSRIIAPPDDAPPTTPKTQGEHIFIYVYQSIFKVFTFFQECSTKNLN